MKKMNWLMIALLIICVIMLVLYFCNVTNQFSSNSSEWGNFGAYLGSIAGLLAFAGVLYSLQLSEKRAEKSDEISKKRYTEESERIIFFQLLELHTKKFESVTYKDMSGAEAFKKYVELVNNELQFSPSSIIVPKLCSSILVDGKNQLLKITSDLLYKEYGHITGHYFRNMFYVMKTIKGFSNNEKYVGLFRAQLSRYELALGLFNAVSSNSSKEMIDLLKEFKVFKDIYPEDITIIKILFENDKQQGETSQEKMLRITNSLLDDWKSDN